MAIIIDTCRLFTEAPDHKFSSLIREMKKNLNNPNISNEEKIKIASRIAAIESSSSTRARNENIELLIYSIYELGLSCLFGPVGAGIGTMSVSNRRRNVQARQNQKITKARVIGGRRYPNKKSRKPSSYKLDKTSVVEGISSYVQGALWIAAMVPVSAAAGRVWSNCSSYLGY